MEPFKFEKVMIVDDTSIDRYVVSHIMKKNDFADEVIEYDMATKAIAFLEQNYDKPETLPQVIILDINMPEMDGFQFLERLALLPEYIKQCCTVIMLSSSLSQTDHERAENNPIVKKFINKPLNKANLEEIRSLYFKAVGG